MSDANKSNILHDVVEKRAPCKDQQTHISQSSDKNKSDFSKSRKENISIFLENLDIQKQSIENGLILLHSKTTLHGDIIHEFNDLSENLLKLQRCITECMSFLPSYEVRNAKKIVIDLQNKIKEQRDVILPSKKFSFSKAKKNETTFHSSVNDNVADESCDVAVDYQSAACTFIKHSNEDFSNENIDINGKDVALVELCDCKVKLFGSPSAINIFNLKHCTILSGPVSGSIFIRSCTDCYFGFPCQQLRIHSTYDCDFYIHVTCKAIIEDCMRVHFAPFNWNYATLQHDYNVSGLDRFINNWNNVDDFDFLANDVASPNWSIIDESKRIYVTE